MTRTALAIAVLVVLACVGLITRPILPVSEARTLAIAWEMWRTGDWLVPTLNGAPYPDKPPVVFWAMLAGWSVLDVSETWARLVAPLFGLGCLVATVRLARLLWPDRPMVAGMAPVALVGFPLFALFATLALFDVPLAFWVVLGHLGVAFAWRGRIRRGWLLLGVGLGLGALTKGPVILLHLLPVPLLAPLWAVGVRWRRWYAGLAAAGAIGAAIALAWALPAAVAGGPAYTHALLWGQTAGRLAQSFAHAQPWWWYLPLVPLVLYPWAWWPPLWRAAASDPGVRFAAVWLAVPFLGFCLISGKQPNYLIPLLPAAALIGARWIGAGVPSRRWDPLLPLGPMLILSLGALVVATAPEANLASVMAARHAAQWSTLPVPVPLALAFVLAGLLVVPWPGAVSRVMVGVVSALVAAHVAFGVGLAERYDLRPLARFVAAAQAAGRPVAHIAGYEGHLGFVGRLEAPITALRERDIEAWAMAHPDGVLITTVRERDRVPAGAALILPFRSGWSVVWDGATAARLGKNAIIGD
ncbi:MAG: glycosyltransferase family 39 protein [Alphaproteobacteria bacterium]|nr:glycosyltransferase family 39 protein [Alphaproteobacteria bacterium]